MKNSNCLKVGMKFMNKNALTEYKRPCSNNFIKTGTKEPTDYKSCKYGILEGWEKSISEGW